MRKLNLLLMVAFILCLGNVQAALINSYNFTDTTSPIEDIAGSADLTATDAYTQTADVPVYNMTSFNGTPTALDADGSNDRFDGNQDMDAWTEISICGWINMDGNSGEDHIWNHGEDAGCGTQRLYVDGNLKFAQACGTTSQTNQPANGVWTHVCATSKEGGTQYIYINGSVADSDAAPADFGNPTTAFYVAGRSSGEYANLQIDTLDIYDHQLSQAQVNNHYNCGTNESCDFAVSNILFTSDGLDEACAFPASCSTTADTTPTFSLDTNHLAVCRISSTDEDYEDMSTDCTPAKGADESHTHSCTSGALSEGINILYIACNSTESGVQTSPVGNSQTINITIAAGATVDSRAEWLAGAFNATTPSERDASDNIGYGSVYLGSNGTFHDHEDPEPLSYLQMSEFASRKIVFDEGRAERGTENNSWTVHALMGGHSEGTHGTYFYHPGTTEGMEKDSFALTNNWSMCFWSKNSAGSGSQSVFWDTPTFSGEVSGTNRYCQVNNAGGDNSISVANPHADGIWTHQCCVYNTDGNLFVMYLDGVNRGNTNPRGGSSDIQTNWEISTRNAADGFNGEIDSFALWNFTITQQQVLDMMGNETAGRKPNYRSECLDAGSARDWHTFKQDITLEGTDINASVCTYSDSGCSADESCQTIGNGTTTDISGLTNSQYAQVYYEFLAFSEPAYDANSTLNAYWLLGLSASQPSSVTQINLTSYPFNKECPDHPAWCANTTDRTP